MSDTVWLAWIAIVALVVKQVLEWISAWIIAKRVAEVKDKLVETTTAQDEKLVAISVQVEEVHRATNGMKTELVEEVRKASFAQGVKSEVDKEHGNAPDRQ